jgi:hypothetical protein
MIGGRSRDFGLDALETGRPLSHRLESGSPCLRRSATIAHVPIRQARNSLPVDCPHCGSHRSVISCLVDAAGVRFLGHSSPQSCDFYQLARPVEYARLPRVTFKPHPKADDASETRSSSLLLLAENSSEILPEHRRELSARPSGLSTRRDPDAYLDAREGLAGGLPQTPPCKWRNWYDEYAARRLAQPLVGHGGG